MMQIGPWIQLVFIILVGCFACYWLGKVTGWFLMTKVIRRTPVKLSYTDKNGSKTSTTVWLNPHDREDGELLKILEIIKGS